MRTYGLKTLAVFVMYFLGNLALMCIMCLILAWLIMLLWNWVMPTVFGLPALSYWQAWGLDMLIGLLFNAKLSISKNEQ